MEARIESVERELAQIARHSEPCKALASVPGIGLLTSTAMLAAVGDARSFDSGRRYASFFGLTPREYSSGDHRYLGRISKRGNRYVRMLLTHGARSVLRSASVARRAGAKWTGCAPGRSRCRRDPTTTRRPAPSPTSLRASPGPSGRSKSASKRRRHEHPLNPLPPFAKRDTAHHGNNGRTGTGTSR